MFHVTKNVLVIRPMNSGDLPRVEAIYRALHPRPMPARDWSRYHVIVTARADTVAGYAAAQLLLDNTFLLTETLVLPEFQGRGIGRRLMEARLRLGQQLGATEALGGCDDDHTAMVHLLLSQGFRPVEREDAQTFLGRPNARLYSRSLKG